MADTLCASCTRGANECSFMEDMVPVPGWKAKRVVYEHQQGGRSYTYVVKECPLYHKMPLENHKRGRYQTKKCAFCGKEFEPKQAAQKYCSRVCSKRERGEQWT